MRVRNVLLDTSFIVALENLDDPYHERAIQLDRQLLDQDATLVLHWGILLEIGDGYARLGRREKGHHILERIANEDSYEVVSLTMDLMSDALGLYHDRQDKEWGLTDCMSFTIMKRRHLTEALTADQHFVQAGFDALLL